MKILGGRGIIACTGAGVHVRRRQLGCGLEIARKLRNPMPTVPGFATPPGSIASKNP
jgi:hypothetical protein